MATRPTLPMGYHTCSTTPAGVALEGERCDYCEQSYSDWRVFQYVDVDDYLYFKFVAIDGSDQFWAYPDEMSCAGATPTTSAGDINKSNIRSIQKALNSKYRSHSYYPLVVDGKWGPKTCTAAFGFQSTLPGVTSTGELTADFFLALGLPEAWAATGKYGDSCASYYQKGVTPAPVPKPEEPVIEPVPSTFPWMETLIGAAGGSLIGLAGKKTVLKKRTRLKTWHAGVGGALLGAIGGFIWGKNR